MAHANLLSELLLRVNSRIDFTAKLSLRGRQGTNYFAERHGSYHEQIDIASGASRAFRHGAIDERNVDHVLDLSERVADDLHGAERLEEDTLQFGEDRGGLTGLVIHLPPLDMTRQ
jgi:hypothetical protein